MSKVIEQKIPKIIGVGQNGASKAIIIPATWRLHMGLKDDTPLIMRLKETKFGFAIELYEQKEELKCQTTKQ